MNPASPTEVSICAASTVSTCSTASTTIPAVPAVVSVMTTLAFSSSLALTPRLMPRSPIGTMSSRTVITPAAGGSLAAVRRGRVKRITSLIWEIGSAYSSSPRVKITSWWLVAVGSIVVMVVGVISFMSARSEVELADHLGQLAGHAREFLAGGSDHPAGGGGLL